MRVTFDEPSDLEGEYRVPPSKSYTHRAYLAALLTGGGRVNNPLRSEDTDATYRCLKGFSFDVTRSDASVTIAQDGHLTIEQEQFSAEESGTLLRFLIPILTILDGPEEVCLLGEGSLRERSNEDVIASLKKSNFDIEATGSSATVPITCYPGQDPPSSEPIHVATESTSQLLSGWLLALSALNRGGLLRRSENLVSEPYVEMTLRVLEQAGVSVSRPNNREYEVIPRNETTFDYRVPGDYSSAAFFIVGAVLTAGTLKCSGLVKSDVQGDKILVRFLRDLGASVEWTKRHSRDVLEVNGSFRPDGFELDASDCPDLVPILAVFSCFADGKVTIQNISHLKNKESDRINRTCEELAKCGMEVQAHPERIEIFGGRSEFRDSFVLDAHNDHRLAMAFSILCMVLGEGTVEGIECVSKSYPDFYDDLEQVGVRFETE